MARRLGETFYGSPPKLIWVRSPVGFADLDAFAYSRAGESFVACADSIMKRNTILAAGLYVARVATCYETG